MEPVVNRIEESFPNDVEVLRLDANQSVGKDAFRFYRMQGHPAFVLLNPEGEVLWSGIGIQDASIIDANIQEGLMSLN